LKRGRIVLALGRLFLIPAVVLAVTPLLSAQTTPPAPPKKPPELNLEIVPAKKIYLVGEVVVVKYKLTNPTDKTVCFPRPDTKTEERNGRLYSHSLLSG